MYILLGKTETMYIMNFNYVTVIEKYFPLKLSEKYFKAGKYIRKYEIVF